MFEILKMYAKKLKNVCQSLKNVCQRGVSTKTPRSLFRELVFYLRIVLHKIIRIFLKMYASRRVQNCAVTPARSQEPSKTIFEWYFQDPANSYTFATRD